MSQSPSFDLAVAHQWFSTDCFNRVWTLLEKPNRTPEEDEQMISLAHASLAHWREREDCTPQNLSIGYWQLSRVFTVLGRKKSARRYGQHCLDISVNEPPFFRGYAHEALARAAKLKGAGLEFNLHLKDAKELVDQIEDVEDRKLLQADLAELESA